MGRSSWVITGCNYSRPTDNRNALEPESRICRFCLENGSPVDFPDPSGKVV